MKHKNYQPGSPGDATTEHVDGHWTLVFVRELKHPPDAVWLALTDPTELRAWAPFDSDRNLGSKGEATLTMAGGDGSETMQCKIERADRPRVLEYLWGEDRLRWELEPHGGGTRLTLRHTVADRSWMSKVAAGWHICFDVMDRALAGDPVGRIVAEEANDHGWERLEKAYAERFA
jgi:uncharacterized protein YndB with AHSA1/START domain